MHHQPHNLLGSTDNWIFIISSVLIVLYSFAALYSTYKKGLRRWPPLKILYWALGLFAITISVEGPLAQSATVNFEAHMMTHLLLGMLAPLLIVLSSPMTLFLRTIPVRFGRKVSKILNSAYGRTISHPVTAAFLNVGGLWLLYTTDLYHSMHESLSLHILIHFHVFAAGYLFTSAIIYLDPISHRFSYAYRTVVFIFALAGHGILSKFIYANPPAGVPIAEAERGAMLMYYGGDLIDAVLIIILFTQWYRSLKPAYKTKQLPVEG